MAMFEITPGIIESYLIGKGLNPADAKKFSTQPWVQDFARQAASGNIPKGLPELNAETVASFKSQAKQANQPLMDYVQSRVAPTAPLMSGMGARSAGQAMASIPAPSRPTFPGVATGQQMAQAPSDMAGFLKSPELNSSYRLPYLLSDADLSDKVVNKIAGEIIPGDPESAKGTINNMFNRLGSPAYKDSDSLSKMIFAPQQYTGNRKAGPEEAAMIRSTIREVASGQAPDPTGGATDYRAHSYFQGRGKGLPAYQKATEQGYLNVGGNVYFRDKGSQPGPHVSTATGPSPFTNIAQKTDIGRGVPFSDPTLMASTNPSGQPNSSPYYIGENQALTSGDATGPVMGAFPNAVGTGAFPKLDPSMPLPSRNPGMPQQVASLGNSPTLPMRPPPLGGAPGSVERLRSLGVDLPPDATIAPSLPAGFSVGSGGYDKLSGIDARMMPGSRTGWLNGGGSSPLVGMETFAASNARGRPQVPAFQQPAMGPANPTANMGLPMSNPIRASGGSWTPPPALTRDVSKGGVPGSTSSPPSSLYGGAMGTMLNAQAAKAYSASRLGPPRMASMPDLRRLMGGAISPYGMNVGFGY